MWVIPYILLPFLSLSEGKSSLMKQLKRNASEISVAKFAELCTNIGCRPPGGRCDYLAFTLEEKIVCTCNKNYTGDLCQHRCSIDCGDHGSCVLFGQKEKCVCWEGYSGETCGEKVMDNIEPKQIRPRTESNISSKTFNTGVDMECSPKVINFPCNQEHGRCVKRRIVTESSVGFAYRCVCNEGWIGDFCDTPCNKKCLNGGICHVMNSGARKGEEVCLCNWNTTGEFCEKPKPFHSLIYQRKLAEKRNSINDVIKPSSSADTKSVKDQQTSKNHISRRSVRNGFCKLFCGSNAESCTTRELQNYRYQVFFICKCKRGWTGHFCTEKCSLPCQNGGKCFFDKRNRQEICIDCNEGYRGVLCENKIENIFKKFRF